MNSTIPHALLGVLGPGGNWHLEVEGVHETNSPVFASLMAIGNGYVGIRGEIGLKIAHGGPREVLVAGLHESWPIIHAEDAYGLARTGQTLLALPDLTELALYVDGDRMSAGAGEFLEARRSLDMRSGVIETTVVWRAPSGALVRAEQKCAVSATSKELAVVTLTVEALDQAAEIRVESTLNEAAEFQDFPAEEGAAGASDPRAGDARARTSHRVESRHNDMGEGVVVLRTQRSGMKVAIAYSHAVDAAGAPIQTEQSETEHAQTTTFSAQLEPSGTLRVSKALAFSRSQVVTPRQPWARIPVEVHSHELVEQAHEALANYREEGGAYAFFDSQAAVFGELWHRRDIQIRGDGLIQKALRWTVFHLLQAGVRVHGSSISAKGLTGTGYDGHYFWDTEIYLLPFYTFTMPRSAREALRYRFDLLPAARERAAEMNESGALFPWRSISGDEASAYYPAGTAQYHIDADVSYAVNQYVSASSDYQYLVDEGFEVLVETSRLWCDLGFWREDLADECHPDGPKIRKFHFYGVTGPDEYTAVVNDNFYTNVMARANLRSALRWARWLQDNRSAEYTGLAQKLQLTPEELEQFHEIAEGIEIPFDKQLGIHAQDDAFLGKPHWDFQGVPQDKYPLLHNFHSLVIYRHQVLKQADAVLALVLCGSEFTPQQKRADFDYYDPITTGDSSLSAGTQSMAALAAGYDDLAWNYFERALGGDLANYYGNSDHGLHLASLGGAWQATVMGFGGLSLRDSTPVIQPRLPSVWESLKYNVQIDGQWLAVHVHEGGVQVTLDEGATRNVTLDLAGQKVTLRPGGRSERPLRA